MEAIGQILEKATQDLLKPGSQEKQTGLNEPQQEKCQKHGVVLRVKRGYMGEESLVCWSCEQEEYNRNQKVREIQKCHDGIGLSERLRLMTFSSYIPKSEKEAAAKKACEDYASDVVSGGPGGLILLGGVGTGKTHLAIAVCKKVCDEAKAAKLTSVPKIIRHIRSSWSDNATDEWGKRMTEDEVIRSYSDYALLVIDEIGVQYGTPAEKITISEVINERYNRMRPTILIGNVKISEAEEFLGARVVDRVKDEGRVLIFDWQSHRQMKK